MAKAVFKITPKVIPDIFLELTGDEVKALYDILRRVAGEPLTTRRKFSQSILSSLEHLDPKIFKDKNFKNDISGTLTAYESEKKS